MKLEAAISWFIGRPAQMMSFTGAGTGALATTDTQSIIHSAGRQAYKIESLWWLFLSVLAAIYVLVLVFVALAVIRRRRTHIQSLQEDPEIRPPVTGTSSKGLTVAVSLAVGATVIILFGLLIAEYGTAKSLNQISASSDPLKVKVRAQQWWWQVQYSDPVTSNIVTTANELHLPLGRPVEVSLESQDVIHSFWVPNLNGKRDAIPGYTSKLWLQADEPGTFQGQCAEFCGYQHAHMRFTVTAEEPHVFEAWLNAQRQSALAPQTDSQKLGQEVFMRSSCIMCHTISGTPARATVGPDLSHIATRPTIAAGTLPNNRGNLAGWILDPQSIKPGTRMPQNNIPPQELHALLDYLESLK